MFRNFIKIAFRNIRKHKGFSFINIAGLTLGLTACILIGLFVHDEYQYDKFFRDGDQIFRIYELAIRPTGTDYNAVTSPRISTELGNYPEVAVTARVMMLPSNKILFESGNKKLYEESGFYVDSTFFGIFDMPFKYGSSINALNGPSSIVLSDDMAERFFGNTNPIGKQILMDKRPFIVKGVFKSNSKFHLQFQYLVPIAAAGISADRMQSWVWQQFYTYVKIKPSTSVAELQSRFQQDVKRKSEAFLKELKIENIPFFQNLKEIHLYSYHFKFDLAQRGNITYVNGFIIIAGIILIIACFNFVNLSTARSLQRAKEVGIMKTLGAQRKLLVFQFIGETLIFTLIGTLLSLLLTIIFLPWLNNFTDKHINASVLLETNSILAFLSLVFIVSVGAGIYPALILSGFSPIKVLKSNISYGELPGKIPWLRNGMVVAQFALTVTLLICTLIVFRQVDFLHNKDLGFDRDRIMFFPMRGDNMFRNHESFKNDLQKSSGISSVTIGYGFPGDAVAGDDVIVNRNGENKKLSAVQLMVDFDYIKTLSLQLVAGRDFSRNIQTDPDHAFIINETAVKQMGFGTPQAAIGQKLQWNIWNDKNPDSLKTGQVIGVVKDFYYKSLYDRVETTVLQIFPDAYWKVAVKIKSRDLGHTIEWVKNVWAKYSPEFPIEYKFMDENFVQIYKGEDKLRNLLWVFASLAIFIGCMGLFGLAAYSAERRKKEIGIRKVLGATTENLVMLLSGDFTRLIIAALCIAAPAGYYFMTQWLNSFAYRISINWWIFALAAIIALGIAIITISSQAIKAAMANPVKSLKTE
jgi:putative ABC transport system permease protein